MLFNIIDSVKDKFTAKKGRSHSSNLDYSYITPTLLALGKFNETKVDELLHVLQGQPAVLWNLSGKPLQGAVATKLNCQIIDNPWVTPGHFTQAPSLECVFRQCYSIKAWLDLRQDNVAILHCGNGRSRTGILMACFLKYIGAFDHTSDAFDFFCGVRVRSEVTPTLSPSYRILFENVDRSTDYGGSPNPFPLHLKCMALSGLPVDDVPCVEVWDMSGLVFNSHSGLTHSSSRCSWSAECGDGLFKIASDIVGDFSVMCRFGGSHALTRDKTTLIFKYQNSTAFLPPDCIELSKLNVDINPEYVDSLDDGAFSVHLLFEAANEKALEKVENREFANTYQLRGKEAFESGLDEISKYHHVEPDGALCGQLADLNFPSEYVAVALQLGNNDPSLAQEAIRRMMHLGISLQGVAPRRPVLPASPFHVKLQKTSLGIAKSGEKARQAIMQLDTGGLAVDLFPGERKRRKSRREEKPAPVGGDRRSMADDASENSSNSSNCHDEQSPRAQAAAQTSGTATPSPPSSGTPSDAAEDITCAICKDSSYAKRDQLVPCSQCRLLYHTQCFGARRIPFTIKSVKERTNRSRYIARNYAQWLCPRCHPPVAVAPTPTVPVPSASTSTDTQQLSGSGAAVSSAPAACPTGPVTGAPLAGLPPAALPGNVGTSSGGGGGGGGMGTGASWVPSFQPSGKVAFQQSKDGSVVIADGQTLSLSTQDDVAKLMTLLSSSGITLDQLLNMEPAQQTDTLVAAAKKSAADDRSSTQSPLPRRPPPPSPASSATGSGSSALAIKILTHGQSVDDLSTPPILREPLTAAQLKTVAKADGRYSKYLKMFQVGLPMKTIDDRIHADGLDPAAVLASINTPPAPPEPSVPATPPKSPGSSLKGTSPAADAAAAAGTAAAAAARSRGGDGPTPMSDPLALPPAEGIPPAPASDGKVVYSDDDATFGKYFGMLKLGLPKSAVAYKMQADGAVPSKELGTAILDRRPIDPGDLGKPRANGATVPPDAEQKSASDAQGAEHGNSVCLRDHSVFGKYFKMLKAGIPYASVRAKAEQAGLDPTVLDRDPAERVPEDFGVSKEKEAIEEPGGSESSAAATVDGGGMVPLKDHPVYSKYLRMLKVGLPAEAVRSKMELENADPSYLDKDPLELVPLEVKQEVQMVALKDHPSYEKYLKMLKVGLPLPAAKQKMQDDGFDPSILDLKPSDMVPLDPSVRKAPEPKKLSFKKGNRSPAAKIRKKKLHWKALDASKVGANSLWADEDDEDDDFHLDPEEFNQLFVEKEVKGKDKKPSGKAEKRKVVSLVDAKRAQNAGIALARLKIPFCEVRQKIEEMDDTAFTSDQFRSLQEFLPTVEEKHQLDRYVGSPELLGVAEKYMMEMKNSTTASQCISCILYKQHFKSRLAELNMWINRIEGACDDVKMSLKLKKVLKTILKVGNQMNDGEQHLGFTVDSLLKLQNAKAFDKKTSILQYVVMVIQRNDESCLLFPEDLTHLTESERMSLSQISQELDTLRASQVKSMEVVREMRVQAGDQSVASMVKFLEKAQQSIDEVSESVNRMQEKYQTVLAYFGEDPDTLSQEFFSTLEKFVRAFVEERENAEKVRKAEQKKERQARQSATAAPNGLGGDAATALPKRTGPAGGKAMRRSSAIL